MKKNQIQKILDKISKYDKITLIQEEIMSEIVNQFKTLSNEIRVEFDKNGSCTRNIGFSGLHADAETIETMIQLPNSVGVVGETKNPLKTLFFLPKVKDDDVVPTVRKLLGVISVSQGVFSLTAVDSMKKVPPKIEQFEDLYNRAKDFYCFDR